MHYFKKSERYEQILHTAISVLIEEGIAAITARKIASKANIAVGLIHNHFSSIGELKAMALINFTDQLIALQQDSIEHKTPIEKIINAVSPIHGKDGVIFKNVWNEALFLSTKDPDIKYAYQRSTNEWHEYVVQSINSAISAGALHTTSPTDLAWRLIALSCGFDNLSIMDEFDQTTIHSHIMAILKTKSNLVVNL